MHGYGPTPQQQTTSRPSPATLTTVRVVLVTVTVLSCGLLGWVAMLRLAIVTRRPRDWVLLVVVMVLNAALFAFIVGTPDDPDDMSDASVLLMLLWIVALLAGVITYYLYVEIRHYSSLRSLGSPAPYTAPAHAASLPYQQHPAQQQQHQQHQQQHQHPQPNPYTVQTPPPTPTPAPQRLDQVRAELDELSDYLRKENREGEGR
ncbi:hypothetical protein [Streptomyces anulatus]|uniref:hypothetical protein n=1 Tax=Streptomyces anulatus TaxID=1892 RepID=UPI0022580E0D|nr:hypothetical protein [Streptomyces anulatus]MCX4485149.1 hypothetical protein [Streptomyces anulatus]MCX4518797.1 hypothetical protein [Streptomyces anulatus]MCX4601677.1 hypothetical protein [Streptomyces anulatus]WSU74059.1 hypothetical protein OG499_14340 [Streptomyces anulatus]WTD10314.1 hypothetical protein OHA54_14125 [Streptomyces anulatus]